MALQGLHGTNGDETHKCIWSLPVVSPKKGGKQT